MKQNAKLIYNGESKVVPYPYRIGMMFDILHALPEDFDSELFNKLYSYIARYFNKRGAKAFGTILHHEAFMLSTKKFKIIVKLTDK